MIYIFRRTQVYGMGPDSSSLFVSDCWCGRTIILALGWSTSIFTNCFSSIICSCCGSVACLISSLKVFVNCDKFIPKGIGMGACPFINKSSSSLILALLRSGSESIIFFLSIELSKDTQYLIYTYQFNCDFHLLLLLRAVVFIEENEIGRFNGIGSHLNILDHRLIVIYTFFLLRQKKPTLSFELVLILQTRISAIFSLRPRFRPQNLQFSLMRPCKVVINYKRTETNLRRYTSNYGLVNRASEETSRLSQHHWGFRHSNHFLLFLNSFYVTFLATNKTKSILKKGDNNINNNITVCKGLNQLCFQ